MHINKIINRLKILKAMNEGTKTQHEVYMIVGLSLRTISMHRKEIIRCSECGFFTNKGDYCFYCRSKLNGVLNG